MTTSVRYMILVAIMAGFVATCSMIDFFQDDAYITLTYARNLATGHGLVFNHGEHVEGFTSLLWTLMASLMYRITDDPISIVRWLGILFGALTLLPVHRLSYAFLEREVPEERWRSILSIIPPAILACTAAYQSWTVSGMEVTLFCFLTVSAMCSYIIKPTGWSWTVWTSLALFTRPEAMLVAAFLGVWHLIERRSWVKILPLVAIVVALSAWRYSQFGALLPNTFSAKTGGLFDGVPNGLEYVWSHMLYNWAAGSAFMLVLIGVIVSRKNNRAYIPLLTLTLLWMTAVVMLGGDVLRHQRFMLPILAIALPLLPVGLVSDERLFTKERRYQISAVLGLLFCICAWVSESDAITATQNVENELTSKMKRTGEWLAVYARSTNKHVTVAATTIGALKYYSDQTVIDMLGLTDRTVATKPEIIPEVSEAAGITWKERKYNASYILQRAPDFIIFSTGLKPSAFAERALWAKQVWCDYYFYYYKIPGTESMQTMLRRKKQTGPARVDMSKTELAAVLGYPEAIMLVKSNGPSSQAESKFRYIADKGPKNYSQPYQCIADDMFYKGELDSARYYYLKALYIDRYDVRSHYGMFQIAQNIRDTATLDIHGQALYTINPVMLSLLGVTIPEHKY